MMLAWPAAPGPGYFPCHRIRHVYSEIASNKRRSVLFIGLFFVVWLAIGAACGFLFKALYRHSANNGFAAAPPTNYGWDPVIIGMVIAGLLAVRGILYSLNAGAGAGAPGLGGRARRSSPVRTAA